MNDDLILIAVVVTSGALVAGGLLLLVLLVRRRAAAFRALGASPGWTSAEGGGGEWLGPVLLRAAASSGREVRVGRARLASTNDEYIRFHTRVATPYPRGLYAHSQPFRHNAAADGAPRVAYDGRYDDPSAISLVGRAAEIVLGDDALDRMLLIQGDDEPAIRALLTRPAVRDALLAVAKTGDHLRLRAGVVEIDVDETRLGSLDAYLRRVDLLEALADALDSTGEPG
ncbi:MAG: hypothetical protein AB7S26_19490 [Sandaracinaceae bacterium]